MNMRVINCRVGETVELQTDLRPTDVEAINSGVIAVLHDSETEQTTYERQFKRSHAPKNANVNIPDTAVVADFDGSEIHYLVEV